MAFSPDIAAAMRREHLRSYFDSSPTVRLLRSDLAPLVIDFLYQAFKATELLSMGQSEVRERLRQYQSELHQSSPEIMTGIPDRYLANWVDGGWLKRFIEATANEPQYQLTPNAEEAMRFAEAALDRRKAMVGTEGRLRLIMETLEDVVRGASADPDARVAFLREQQAKLQQEIDAIEGGKGVQIYQPAQIRERFHAAMELLRGLQSDFRAVEDRFEAIARNVQNLQASGEQNRGTILGFALDAADVLKQQDEGISFYAFTKFLLSPTQQRTVRKCIEDIQKLEALSQDQESLQHLRRMVPQLLAEADKVMRTNMRLSATLRRLLDAQATAQRQRLASVLHEIRTLALSMQSEPPESFEFEIEVEPTLQAPLSRPFWSPSASFEMPEIQESTFDMRHAQKVVASLSQLSRLDLRKLRRQIRECTLDGKVCTLTEIVHRFPLQEGLFEILGYMQIASEDGHPIDEALSESMRVEIGTERKTVWSVRLPWMRFQPMARSREGGRKPK